MPSTGRRGRVSLRLWRRWPAPVTAIVSAYDGVYTMKATEILDAIRLAWETVVPPVVNVVLSIWLAWWLTPDLALPTLGRLSTLGARVAADVELQKTLEFFGLSKLLPVIFSVFVLATILFYDRLMAFVGRMVPGNVVFIQPDGFFDAARHQLPFFIERLPKVSSASDFHALFEAELTKISADARGAIEAWQRERGVWDRYLALAKAYVVLALLLILLSATNGLLPVFPLWKFLLFLFVVAGVFVFCLLKVLFAAEQERFAEVSAVHRLLLQQVSGRNDRAENADTRIRAESLAKNYDEGSGWSFQFVDRYWYQWASKVLLRKLRANPLFQRTRGKPRR